MSSNDPHEADSDRRTAADACKSVPSNTSRAVSHRGLRFPTAAAPILSVSAPPEHTPIAAVATSAFPPAVPAPSVGTSPAPHTLVLFHEEFSLWLYPRAPTRVMTSSSSTLPTSTRSATSMPVSSNTGGRTAKKAQRIERGRGTTLTVRGMCLGMLPATSTLGCHPGFWGDRHRHRPIPSGVRVGRQPRPRLAHNRVLSRPISAMQHPHQRRTPNRHPLEGRQLHRHVAASQRQSQSRSLTDLM